MAVKKHELVHDNRNQLDLNALAQYIQLINQQPNYLPPPQELIKNCQDIVKCLARTTGCDNKLLELLQSVEEFLVRVVNTVHRADRHDIVTAILEKFYSYISDPESDACPATSIVLIVLDATDNEASLSAARWLVQQGENGPAGAGHRASLSCLYRWMYEWQGTPVLGNWVLSYIKALEENNRFDILLEVSLDNIERLFMTMNNPLSLRQSVAEVIFHLLASLRESNEALEKISPHVGKVLVSLAADSGQWSRQLLQNLVDILTAMIDQLLNSFEGEEQDIFRDKYADVILCLERHMATRSCSYLGMPAWETRSMRKKAANNANTLATLKKVGLLNIGNTCYMNSVMQVLLVTRQFSTHVLLKMNTAPYWSKMGILFAKMMYSVTTKLNPDEFLSVLKPPFFTCDNQHDSSEFLGYLFELLQSYENSTDDNVDYSRPPVLAAASRMKVVVPQVHSAYSSDSEYSDSSPNRRSVSPRPSSSAGGSSSGAQKRPASHNDIIKPRKKQKRMTDPVYLRRNSFIDKLFGGVLLTRVECSECHSSSLSRDVFRDLQLAFPEKTEKWQRSVQGLLEYYCSKERLSGDNRYECRDCGCLRDAERSVLIEATPKFLILVLKNFKFDIKLQVHTKLMHSIYYNNMVTLPTVRSQAEHSTYSLYAAIIHSGTTLDSGHYYTLAKDNGQWHMYNDEDVSRSEASHINALTRSCTPYILFYRRMDVEEGTAPTLEQLPSGLQQSVAVHNKHYMETIGTT